MSRRYRLSLLMGYPAGGVSCTGTCSPCRCGACRGGLAISVACLPCRCGACRGACPLCCPSPAAFSLLFLPHPPCPPSPPGKGEIFCFLMQGASPLASPGLNPGGTGYPCPGGEDHLKRRSSSPPVPPLLGWRHCSPKPHLNSHAPSGYRNATPRPSRKGQSPSPGTRLAGSASAARVQSRGCKGRSPLHEITLIPPFPPGRGAGGMGERT